MKTNDQKQLELLYEEVGSQPFIMFKKEKEYFDKISDQIAEHIVSKKDGLTKFANMTLEGNQEKYLTDFDRQLFLEPLPWFFDKSNTTKVENAVNKTYKEWIIDSALARILVKKGVYSNSSPVKLEFRHPYNRVRVMDLVDITDKEGIKEALKKHLAKALELWYEHFEDSKGDEDPNMWYDWRTDEIKYGPLKDKLPELEGIF
jgi:hypothetical protein